MSNIQKYSVTARATIGSIPSSILLMGLLVVLNTVSVLIARYTATSYEFNVNHVFVMTEVVKILLSCILEALNHAAPNADVDYLKRISSSSSSSSTSTVGISDTCRRQQQEKQDQLLMPRRGLLLVEKREQEVEELEQEHDPDTYSPRKENKESISSSLHFKKRNNIRCKMLDGFISCSRNLRHSLRVHIWTHPLDALQLAIPAALYLVQRIFLFHAISRMNVPLYQILQQTKIIAAAILSTMFLKKSYSTTQWFSIVCVCIGSALCTHSAGSSSNDNSQIKGMNTHSEKYPHYKMPSSSSSSTSIGLFMILLANLCSSLSGIIFEIMIKKKNDDKCSVHCDCGGGQQVPSADFKECEACNHHGPQPSVWIRNLELSFFTLCILIGKEQLEVFHGHGGTISMGAGGDSSYFKGFYPLLWLQVFLSAGGGLVVASVIKYADNVQKGLSMGLSVILSSALSVCLPLEKNIDLMNDHPRSMQSMLSFHKFFILGSILNIGGCFFFANPTLLCGVRPAVVRSSITEQTTGGVKLCHWVRRGFLMKYWSVVMPMSMLMLLALSNQLKMSGSLRPV